MIFLVVSVALCAFFKSTQYLPTQIRSIYEQGRLPSARQQPDWRTTQFFMGSQPCVERVIGGVLREAMTDHYGQ